MNIAVIPARGGSKRIPRKNIKQFCGKPMIAWSIEAALHSGCFDQVIVSTDDEEIKEAALKYGATVPFMRPAELANDYAGTVAVIKHAAEWLKEQGSTPELICCLYATAPFVSAEDLRKGEQVIRSAKGTADYAFSVTSYAFPIQRSLRITPEGRVQMFYPEHYETRSQDLEEAYHDAGQFYWGTSEAWLAAREVFTEKSLPIYLLRKYVQDIDTPEDWGQAEAMFKTLRPEENEL